MSRPGSSARSEDGPIAGPSRSPANDFYIPQQHDASKGWQSYPIPNQGVQEEEGDFLPMDGQDAYMQTTPYHPQHPLSHPPSHHPHHFQYSNGYPVPPSTSPTAMMGQHNQHPMLQITTTSPNDGFHMHSTPVPQHFYNGPPPPRRPGMPHRHSAFPPTRPAPLQRQYSLQPPPSRVMDPAGHDVFAMPPGSTPIRRPASANNFQVENQFFSIPQGISPARALGPAPGQRPQFSPTADPLITPQTKQFPQDIPSSAASTAMTESSTMTSIASERRRSDSTEGETESPTRKGQDMDEMILTEPPKRVIIAPVRLKGVIGGRTSAKFAKVADDPGVEGVPPGPRPTERPTPSFACIIGQAILRCSAGGLSLEHIYRYVETAYPFFKSGDGAWRNSVRHNLSIHKMFETIPRTEHFPPGKGGIWIIHEEEKIHWPSEDKFIKNFPPSHPHHAVCRQTLHERSKEMEAIAKAQAEGRVYVPKKGKKGKKNEDGSADMIRGNSSMSEGAGPGPSSAFIQQQQQPPMQVHHQQMIHPMPVQPIVESTTPKMPPKIMHPPPFFPTLEDEGTFEEPLIPQGTMVPPRFGQKRPVDEENVFTSAPKRVRVDPSPLAPLPMQDTEPDAYVTPERERQKVMMTSSAFKTPGLVNTSSSPGSSPMPTILRTANHHHPSALQQAWTHDDMSPNTPLSLDAAFDIQPKPKSKRLDDDCNPLPTSMHHHHHHHSPRAPPKTPLTRSSAAADRNMRTPFLAKTPMMWSGSPIMPRMTGYEMSTPAWEMEGILDRLRDYPTGPGAANMAIFSPAMRSPTRSSTAMPLGLRSPLTSTDPSKYAGSGNGASPTKGKFKSTTTTILGDSSAEGSTSPSPQKAILATTSPKIPPPASLLASKGMTIGRQLEVGRRERERTRSGEVPAGV